jgi:hypothetical protein
VTKEFEGLVNPGRFGSSGLECVRVPEPETKKAPEGFISEGLLGSEGFACVLGFNLVVPGAGLEPARCFAPADFESAASTNFATPALG